MESRRRLLIRPLLIIALSIALAGTSAAQTSRPTTTAAVEPELPAAVRQALASTEDSAFSFDQPGFYATLEFVKQCPHSPGFQEEPLIVDDWRDLLERPGEFRGRPITITGTIGRNKAPYRLPTRPHLGQICQLELTKPDQPLACTLILTENASDLPLGASITVTGYFVMIRQYHGPSRRLQQAALLVAPGPTSIGQRVDRPDTGQEHWPWVFGATIIGLLVGIIILRRSTRSSQSPDLRTLRARRPTPISLADDLADWAERQKDLDENQHGRP